MTNYNITLEVAMAHRDAWLAAELALATSQEYSITVGTTVRHLKRANLAEVKGQIQFWESKIASLTPGRSRVRYGVPR